MVALHTIAKMLLETHFIHCVEPAYTKLHTKNTYSKLHTQN